MVFNATFNNISIISWWSVLMVEYSRKPPTCYKSLTNITLSCIEYTSPCMGFEIKIINKSLDNSNSNKHKVLEQVFGRVYFFGCINATRIMSKTSTDTVICKWILEICLPQVENLKFLLTD
jgi:hypothetical protein